MKILLVEDDFGDAKAIKRALAKAIMPVNVVHARDGIEALEVLRSENRQLPDRFLVLLDINMPRMNGIEFLQELRADQALNRAVVFVLTTSDDPRDLDAAVGRQVAGYFLKGKVGRDFGDLLDTLQAYWAASELPRIPTGRAH